MCATTDAAVVTPPGAIANLTATGGAQQVTLEWDDTPTATSYKVFRRNPDGTYPAAATATPATSDFVDTGRTNGTQECYRVLAANGAGDGPQSAETCATPTSGGGGGGGGGGTGTAPGAITALTAAGGQTAVTVDWADVSGATDYYVFKDDGLRAFGAMPIATVTASQYTQTGLPANMPACYKVQAHNATGTGLLSDQICATPTAATGGGNEIPVLPKLDLSGIPARVKVSANRKFTLTFAGTAGLTGAITLRSTKKVATRRGGTKRKRKLGNRAIAAPPSGVIVVTLKLSRKNMKALKRTGKLKVTMTAGLGDLAATRKFTLTAP
jgi:hypothetical protein